MGKVTGAALREGADEVGIDVEAAVRDKRKVATLCTVEEVATLCTVEVEHGTVATYEAGIVADGACYGAKSLAVGHPCSWPCGLQRKKEAYDVSWT